MPSHVQPCPARDQNLPGSLPSYFLFGKGSGESLAREARSCAGHGWAWSGPHQTVQCREKGALADLCALNSERSVSSYK